jgi:hypothetical protein
MQPFRTISAVIIIFCITAVAAHAFEPMTATIWVTCESMYDYVVIGEHPQATDGYDNAFDTISPGNLNADMGQPFISVLILHPEWKSYQQELRGDIRSPAKRHEWEITITSSLPEGSPLNVALRKGESTLPLDMKLTLKENKTGNEHNLRKSSYMIQAAGPGISTKLLIIAEQP